MQPLELALCRSISDVSGINPSDYLMEPKLDGVRLQVVVADGDVRLYTRTNHSATGKLPKVEEAIKAGAGACEGTILDGEAVYFDEQDLPDFGFTAACLGSASGKAATRQRLTVKYLSYVAFDLLFLRGLDLRREPLTHRRQLLEMVVKIFDSKYIRLIEAATPSPEQHETFVSRYGEGSVVKKTSSPYRAGRTGHWLKWKKVLEEDVVVIGSEPGNGKFAGQIGAIVFGQYRNGSLIERGRCSGMNDATRLKLTEHLPLGAVMVISHNGILANGGFRHPQFRQFRNDKRAEDCSWTLPKNSNSYAA
jgi:bifunctional non-homologous end joining protein LigD